MPTKLRFGMGTLGELSEVALAWGMRHPLVVADQQLESQFGFIAPILSRLRVDGLEPQVFFTRVMPTLGDLRDALDTARAGSVDGVIGIGGGSAMDVAKATAAFLHKEDVPESYTWSNSRSELALLNERKIALVLAPTKAGSSSEISAAAAFRGHNNKTTMLYGYGLMPSESIIDPLLSLTVPAEQVAEGVVEMFARVLDPYLTGADSCEPQALMAEALLTVLWRFGPRAVANSLDVEARTYMSWVSVMSRVGLHVEGRQPTHFPLWFLQRGISDNLSAPKGRVLAAILSNSLGTLASCNPDLEQRLLRLTCNVLVPHTHHQDVGNGLEAVESWLKVLGLPTNPQALNLPEDPSDLVIEILHTWGDLRGTLCGLDSGHIRRVLTDGNAQAMVSHG